MGAAELLVRDQTRGRVFGWRGGLEDGAQHELVVGREEFGGVLGVHLSFVVAPAIAVGFLFEELGDGHQGIESWELV